ncbi:PIN-like domain-containing protein [Streptomyces sp. NBC_00247]|uniref:PIN-like domain-containing protein n=1 Tax=Streptomyces sp. NBC_00247 TaxID=2975689 RepID=UPI002E2CB2D5|nr:PIN-like domain-containing protein [Streptomyces sp. NBC_00247]
MIDGVASSPDGNETGGGRGLFDGFAEYRTPSPEDYQRLFTTGLVVVDTNVLLTLYRSNQRTRGDLLAVLDRLRERLWVPHQVLTEFWRLREQSTILGHHSLKAKEVRSALVKAGRSASDALDRWLKQVHVGDDAEISGMIAEHREQLDTVLLSLQSLIDGQAVKDALADATDTNTDPVLARLEPILQGRIGPPLADHEHAAALIEAKRRGEHEIPPGYEDFKTKSDERAAGDYLVWEQTLVEATRLGSEVLFVTGDSKEDWWKQRDGNIAARPRPELTQEMLRRTGCRLFMLQPSGLLEQARIVLDLEVETASVRDLEQLQTTTPSGPEWTSEALEALVDLLLGQADVQAYSMLEAVQNDGFVSRATVYEIGGYAETRMLRGFTRPVKTATKRLEENGIEVGDAESLFFAVYDREFDAVSAKGFRIAQEAVPLLRPIAQKILGENPSSA